MPKDVIAEEKAGLAESGLGLGLTAKIINGDASDASDFDIPEIDYLITSPHYSDNPEDVGNIHDYEAFLEKLVKIYAGLMTLMRNKAYLTIIVKNVKKKGKIYPLAWDIGENIYFER